MFGSVMDVMMIGYQTICKNSNRQDNANHDKITIVILLPTALSHLMSPLFLWCMCLMSGCKPNFPWDDKKVQVEAEKQRQRSQCFTKLLTCSRLTVRNYCYIKTRAPCTHSLLNGFLILIFGEHFSVSQQTLYKRHQYTETTSFTVNFIIPNQPKHFFSAIWSVKTKFSLEPDQYISCLMHYWPILAPSQIYQYCCVCYQICAHF